MNAYSLHETLVKIDNVSLTLGDNVILSNVNHEIRDIKRAGMQQGQVVCTLGPSGVGKTQLFRCISGLQKPTSGQVLIGAEAKPVQSGDVGVVPQQYTLFRHRRVIDNLLVAAAQRSMDKDAATQKAMGYLERFGIADKASLFPAQLSGGQRQRVAIIQQLLSSGHFLLMDEPFSGLDPIMKDEAISLINDVARQDDLNTIIVTTHDVEAAILIADQLVLLGRNKDAPGSSIKKVYDLAAMGMAWRPDLKESKDFFELSKQIYADFRTL
jgi:ABC-type nitrate/sulfonate/bicarbonate transport system ATPase subunit